MSVSSPSWLLAIRSASAMTFGLHRSCKFAAATRSARWRRRRRRRWDADAREGARPAEAGSSRDHRFLFGEMEHRLHPRPPFAGTRVRRRLLQRFHQPLPLGDTSARRLMVREDARDVEAVGEIDDHHRRAPEEMNVHPPDAGAAQARYDFGPDPAMMITIRGNGGG